MKALVTPHFQCARIPARCFSIISATFTIERKRFFGSDRATQRTQRIHTRKRCRATVAVGLR